MKQGPWVWSLDQENPLERRIATHSTILAWKIPWTEKLGGIQLMGYTYHHHFLEVLVKTSNYFTDFPNSSVGKESTCNAGDPGSIPGSGRSTGEGKDKLLTPVFLGFPCGLAGKESACNAGDLGSIPGLGRSPGEGKGYPLWYPLQIFY